MTADPVHIIGATGRTGLALCRSLRADGVPVVPVVRNPARWPGPELPRVADLADAAALQTALSGARRVTSAAHARHAGAILSAAPADARCVFLGSTRKFTRWPDAHGDGVLAGEAAFRAARQPGVMLHPTMIYGAAGEDNVRRLAALLRRLPLVPLPGGGRALVQPIWQHDVVRAVRAALDHPWTAPEVLVIAGPAPLPYADFVRAVARAAGLAPPRILPLPAAPLMAAAWLTHLLPGPTIRPAEIRRLLEHKAFDIGPMQTILGFTPQPLEVGLAETFTRSASP